MCKNEMHHELMCARYQTSLNLQILVIKQNKVQSVEFFFQAHHLCRFNHNRNIYI